MVQSSVAEVRETLVEYLSILKKLASNESHKDVNLCFKIR